MFSGKVSFKSQESDDYNDSRKTERRMKCNKNLKI